MIAVHLTLALVQSAGAAASDSARMPSADSVATLFPVGEQLIYDAKLGIISLGEATMEIVGIDTVRDEPSLHFQFRVQGGVPFYKLNDVMDSWVGLRDFYSRRYVQDYDEGGRERYRAWEIFPDSGFYRFADQPDTTFETAAEPLDDAAFFYFLRLVDLEPGRRYEYHRYFRPDRNPVVLEITERDTIDVPAGRFATVVAKPVIKGRGILGDAADARIWLSDDDRRVVVQIKSKFIRIGTITMRLKDVRIPDASR